MVLDGITQKLLGSKSTAASVTLGTGNLIVIAHKLHKVTVIHSLALTITVKINFGQNHLLQNPFTIGRKIQFTHSPRSRIVTFLPKAITKGGVFR